jgi:hypothetical protein
VLLGIYAIWSWPRSLGLLALEIYVYWTWLIISVTKPKEWWQRLQTTREATRLYRRGPSHSLKRTASFNLGKRLAKAGRP